MLSIFRRVPFVVMAVLFAVIVGAAALAAAQSDGAATNQDGDVEVIDGVEYTHRFLEVDDLTWHYVEAGAGEPVVFLRRGQHNDRTQAVRLDDLVGQLTRGGPFRGRIRDRLVG